MVGNLVAEPELRLMPCGQPVATFRIASTPRIYDNNKPQVIVKIADGEEVMIERYADGQRQ